MADTITATIEAVTSKEGASNGRPWKKYSVKTEDGTFYSTFDGAVAENAHALTGQLAEIVWKASGDQGQFKDILAAKAATGFDAGAIPQARDESGAPDWDEIGLRKTRCVLWAHYLQSPLAALIAKEPGEKPAANRVFDIGQALILFAESDIYRRPIADDAEDVPF